MTILFPGQDFLELAALANSPGESYLPESPGCITNFALSLIDNDDQDTQKGHRALNHHRIS